MEGHGSKRARGERLAEFLSDRWNALLHSIRHPDAQGATVGADRDFEGLARHKHCLVVSYRRSGDGIPTPVWAGVEGNALYFRSEARAAKILRIRANPRVVVAPCDMRGKPHGDGIAGYARILPPEEEARAEAAIQARFGVGRRLYEGVVMNVGPAGAYVEVTPAGDDA
jgi:PPOX class probable F420-dependent enzyme